MRSPQDPQTPLRRVPQSTRTGAWSAWCCLGALVPRTVRLCDDAFKLLEPNASVKIGTFAYIRHTMQGPKSIKLHPFLNSTETLMNYMNCGIHGIDGHSERQFMGLETWDILGIQGRPPGPDEGSRALPLLVRGWSLHLPLPVGRHPTVTHMQTGTAVSEHIRTSRIVVISRGRSRSVASRR